MVLSGFAIGFEPRYESCGDYRLEVGDGRGMVRDAGQAQSLRLQVVSKCVSGAWCGESIRM